jgi:ABC-type amino acid transport substrate-binding protein
VASTLRVGAAFPDPPFNDMNDDDGLDISMMRAIGDELGMHVEFIRYRGISTARIAIAVRREDAAMLHRLNAAQARLEEDRRRPQIRRKWLGSPLLDQSGPSR